MRARAETKQRSNWQTKKGGAYEEIAAREPDGLAVPSDDSAVDTVGILIHILSKDAGLKDNDSVSSTTARKLAKRVQPHPRRDSIVCRIG